MDQVRAAAQSKRLQGRAIVEQIAPDSHEAEAVLVASSIRQSYETRGRTVVSALDGVNLTIKRGEFVTIVGKSGCGKTTLLKVLAGLVVPTSGSVRFRGEPVRGPRREFGLVFQTAALLPWRTVLKNVMLPVEVLRLDKNVYESRARDLIELVGLGHVLGHYPNELSGGMQQRVAIARALVTDPEVLMMDEPFGALDAMTRETMNVETMRICLETGKTTVFVTHSISEAVFLGNRIVVMESRPGRIAMVYSNGAPQPRSLGLMNSSEFGALVGQVRSHFGSAGSLANPS